MLETGLDEKRNGGDGSAGSGSKYIYSADSDKFEKVNRAKAFAQIVNAGRVSPDASALNNVNPRKTVDKSASDTTQVYACADGTPWECKISDSDILLLRPNQTFQWLPVSSRRVDPTPTISCHHDFMLSDDVVRKVHVATTPSIVNPL